MELLKLCRFVILRFLSRLVNFGSIALMLMLIAAYCSFFRFFSMIYLVPCRVLIVLCCVKRSISFADGTRCSV